MDVLILSCGTGGGHNSAGKAILEEMLSRGHNAKMFNPYSLRSKKLEQVINSTYIKTVQKTPKLFGAIYKAGDLYRKLPFRSPVYFANGSMVKIIGEYLNENHFDIIIMPHVFPAEILTNLRNHRGKLPNTMFVSTDYACIPFTEETICDAYISPNEDLTPDFTVRGIPQNKIYPYGIPAVKAFSDKIPKEIAKKKLGLEFDKKHIIISGGSMGAGKIDKLILKLEDLSAEREDIKLVVICGSNEALKNRLSQIKLSKTKIIGSTDQMALYLKAGDIYITKPGGLSSTEAAVSGIPIIHIVSIPGCETKNAEYFKKHNMSIVCKNSDDAAKEALSLIDNDKLMNEIIENQKRIISYQSAEKICSLAEEMCQAD